MESIKLQLDLMQDQFAILLDWYEEPSSSSYLHWHCLSDPLEDEDSPFTPWILHPIHPLQTDVSGSLSTEFNKHQSAPFTHEHNQNEESLNGSPSESTQKEPSDSDSSMSEDSASPRKSKPARKAKKSPKRKDDNNNAHKKFITIQNEELKRLGILQKIKAHLKKNKVKFFKGSRHSFVIRLIDAQSIASREIFVKFVENFCSQAEKQFRRSEKAGLANELLESLIPHYTESCDLFMAGRREEATAVLYDIPGAKEDAYRARGIKAVREYTFQ